MAIAPPAWESEGGDAAQVVERLFGEPAPSPGPPPLCQPFSTRVQVPFIRAGVPSGIMALADLRVCTLSRPVCAPRCH